MAEKISVIGGGIGGLSAAILLARRGYDVKLFERNERLGGKMNEFSAQGYRFDTGPSLMTMPFIIDDIFAEAGVDRKTKLDFVPIEPICRYFWADGTKLDASSDPRRMQEEMSKISSHDAKNYDAFFRYARRIYQTTADIFMFTPIHEIRRLMTWSTAGKLFKIHQIDPLRTVHAGVSRFFKHPKIVQLFDRYATYNGSDPYRAPATLNIIPYVEYGLGCYYIRGGMYRLIEEMQQLAIEIGVNINTNSRVQRILHNRGRIRGIQVAGEEMSADKVVSNADVVVAYDELIQGYAKTKEKLNRLEPSLSGLVFLWGMKKKYPELAHHNILFSDDYWAEFDCIFNRNTIPDDPTIYISITSKSDPAHAPAYGENWFVLLNVPYLSENPDWQSNVIKAKEMIMRKLECIGIDIANDIVLEKVYTPLDFFNLYRSNKGSIYGISSNNRSTAFRRPANRNRDIRGLYFCGGSSHPGGGVPLVALSGRLTADLISKSK